MFMKVFRHFFVPRTPNLYLPQMLHTWQEKSFETHAWVGNVHCHSVSSFCLSQSINFSLAWQDYPAPLDQTAAPADMHSTSSFLPTPVLTSAAHSRLSTATPPRHFTPLRLHTPVSASRPRHVQSPAAFRLMSPALRQLSPFPGKCFRRALLTKPSYTLIGHGNEVVKYSKLQLEWQGIASDFPVRFWVLHGVIFVINKSSDNVKHFAIFLQKGVWVKRFTSFFMRCCVYYWHCVIVVYVIHVSELLLIITAGSQNWGQITSVVKCYLFTIYCFLYYSHSIILLFTSAF